MFKIERLEWDSSFFGYEVGKIVVDSKETFKIEGCMERIEQFKLLYVYSKDSIDLLESKLVDRKVIFTQNCYEIVKEEVIVMQSFNTKKHNFEQLKALALESGIYSRFYVDKNFNNQEYERLYTRWIENAVNDDLTFDIILAVKNNSIIGFATLNKKNNVLADIGLVAVSKESRGLGIGKQLMQEALARAQQAGFTEIQVITQLDNLAAMNLYKSTNFKIKEIINIYHLWNL
jgi:dTDP-4-amino-4,6-dideoxy-D-galactose acyltransferase